MSALLLLLPPLLVGWLRPRAEGGGRLPWWLELLAPVLAALALPFVGGTWLVRFRLAGRFNSSDLHEYCGMVAQFERGPLQGDQRSFLWVELLGRIAEGAGIFDALGWGALIGAAMLGLGVYLAGRAASDVWGGLLCALATLAWTPSLALTRMITFYPEVIGYLALAGGVTAMALRTRHLAWVVASAVFAAGAFLADFRGLIWGLMLVPLTAFAAVMAPKGPHRAVRIGVGLLAICLAQPASYVAGREVYHQQARSLEQQALNQGRMQEVGAPADLATRSRYVWGWTRPTQIPATLQTLREGSEWVGKSTGGHFHQQLSARQYGDFVEPWLKLWLGGGLLGLLGLALGRDRPWRLLSLAPLALSVLSVHAGVSQQFSFPRHLAGGAAAPAVALGLGWVGLMLGASWLRRLLLTRLQRQERSPLWLQHALGLLPVVLLLLLLLGIPATWLGPQAEWRGELAVADHHLPELHLGTAEFLDERGQACSKALQAEEASGRNPYGVLWSEEAQ